MLPVVRTRRADRDLIDIWDYVAERDPAAADRVVLEIERRWRQLRTQPRSGVAREDIGPGVRHLVAGQYLILYRVGEAVEILRILHGRRKIGTGLDIA